MSDGSLSLQTALRQMRNAVIEECAKVMDAEAQKWRDGKLKLMPPENDALAAAHDRYMNYIENAKRGAANIRVLIAPDSL